MSSTLPIGTYENAKAMLGHRSEPAAAEVPVEVGLTKALAGLVEDANPSYWEPEFARARWGLPVAPPAALICLFTALHWQPGGKQATSLLCTRIPLPGPTLINTSTDTRFFAPLRVGDWITIAEEFTALSELKTTRLGHGYFVTTLGTFRNQDGELIAESENVLYRYTPSQNGAAA